MYESIKNASKGTFKQIFKCILVLKTLIIRVIFLILMLIK